ncbi:MAG: hypothetical protein H0U75_03710 [Legionella sp.]|nr:hypothetical protein [Legionella sp.]
MRQLFEKIPLGKYITEDLNLTFGSKKEKVCKIPDASSDINALDNQEITLHERLAMVEPVVNKNITSLNELTQSTYIYKNYLAVTVGFVVSTKPHVKEGTHERTFIIVSIDDPSESVIRLPPAPSGQEHPHSEDALLAYLVNPLNIGRLVNLLSHKLERSYSSYLGHKVYAVVLDIHSTNTMCSRCEGNVYNAQTIRSISTSLLAQLEKRLRLEEYILPKEKSFRNDGIPLDSQRLHFVTRVSSQLPYGDNIRPTLKLGDKIIRFEEFFDPLYSVKDIISRVVWPPKIFELVMDYFGERTNIAGENDIPRDIKKYRNGVILHTPNAYNSKYTFFDNKEKYKELSALKCSFFSLPTKTIFGNTNSTAGSMPVVKDHGIRLL